MDGGELVGYLTMLSVLRIHTIADTMVNTSGAISGTRMAGET
jgi:hypothetical protein